VDGQPGQRQVPEGSQEPQVQVHRRGAGGQRQPAVVRGQTRRDVRTKREGGRGQVCTQEQ